MQNEHLNNHSTHLRIRSLNVDKSPTTLQSLLQAMNPKNTDILCIQECLKFLAHLPSLNPSYWTRILPAKVTPNRIPYGCAMYVSTLLNSKTWTTVEIPSTHITAIKVMMSGPEFILCNIYNIPNSNNTIHELRNYFSNHDPDIPILFIGDFNKHHVLWAGPHYLERCATSNTEDLLQLLAELGLDLCLPAGTPMYVLAAHKTTSTIDLVFATQDVLAPCVVKCDAVLGESAWHRMLRVDLDLELVRNLPPLRPLYRDMDWTDFQEQLVDYFKENPIDTSEDALQTIAVLEEVVDKLIAGSEEILRQVVPQSKPSKYSKHWWTRELTTLRKHYHKAQRQWMKRRTAEWWAETIELKKRYRREIKKQKKEHWQGWLMEILDKDIWSAAKYATEPGENAGPTKTPALKDSRGQVQVKPGAKAKLLASSFFPERPNLVRRRKKPLNPLPNPDIDLEWIVNMIKRAKLYSVPGPMGIPNIAIQSAIDFYAPILHEILKVSLHLGHFPTCFKIFKTIVLRKPGKDDYTIPKAYRPIALEETLGKMLESAMVGWMTDTLEANGCLPEHHYGGRAGRCTVDLLLQLTQTIKDAWRRKQVVSVLYLDVSQAFPNVAHERLLERMEVMGLSNVVVSWTESFLSGRTTSLAFDDYTSEPVQVPTGVPQGSPLSIILYLIYSSSLLEIGSDIKEKNDKIYGFIGDMALVAVSNSMAENINKLQKLAMEGLTWAKDSALSFDIANVMIYSFSCLLSNSRPTGPFTRLSDRQAHNVHTLSLRYRMTMLPSLMNNL